MWLSIGASARAQDAAGPRASPVLARVEESFAALSWHRLDNGLEVVLDPRPSGTMVTVAIGIDVGRRDQPRGWTGLAHLAEHLMFRPRRRAPVHFVARMERLGAVVVNGITMVDRTVFYETVPSESLAPVLWQEAERFAHVVEDLDDYAILTEREIVLRERELRSIWHRIAPSLAFEALYRDGHPYADAHVERPRDLAAVDVPAARSFLQRAYVPERTTVAISGSFEPGPTLALVEATLGVLRPSAPPLPPPSAPLPTLAGERRLLVDMPRAHDQLTVLWPTPPYGHDDDAALDLVGHVLEQRLEARLRAMGLSVDARQESAHLASEFYVAIQVPRRVGTAVPLEALDAELVRLETELLAETELAAHRGALVASIARAYDGTTARALGLVRRPPAFGGRYDPRADLARYDRIDPVRLREVVRRWLPRTRRLVVSLNADPRAPGEGRLVRSVQVR
jgi:zinc protease